MAQDLDPMDDEDMQKLSQLLEEHAVSTGSSVGRFILSDLENQRSNFIKVYPKDYKKVMQTQKNGSSAVTK